MGVLLTGWMGAALYILDTQPNATPVKGTGTGQDINSAVMLSAGQK